MVEGRQVLTPEGLEPVLQNAFVAAFAEKGGVQCGFCTPGIIMRACSLLINNPDPSRQDVIAALKNHLCRCTGYIKIVDAILFAAEVLRKNKILEIPTGDGKVGARRVKYDIDRLVLGTRPFVDDLLIDNLKFGALKFSDHPRAHIRSCGGHGPASAACRAA